MLYLVDLIGNVINIKVTSTSTINVLVNFETKKNELRVGLSSRGNGSV